MVGVQYDLVSSEAIYQGADWSKEFQLINPSTNLPYDLSLATIASKARKKYSDTNAAWSFTCSVSNASQGKFMLELTYSQTAVIEKGFYKYDVEATFTTQSGTSVYKVIIPSIVQVVEEYTK